MANEFCRQVRANHENSPLPEPGLPSGKTVSGNVIRFGFYQTRWGRRRRYRCVVCEKTFCSTIATPYYRLQHRRDTFDQVATLSVEGLIKSAIARVEHIGWNTVDRWLDKASDCSRRFNDQELTGFQATEQQADEIRTIIQGKQQPTWIFAAIEVWSRLWSSTVVGRRSYENTMALFRDMAERGNRDDMAGFDNSIIPWLKKRDIAILGWETPDYAPHPPGDLPPSAVHNFALTMLGIHLIDRADFDAAADAAAARNRWEFMLTIALLPIPKSTGSPVNPIGMF